MQLVTTVIKTEEAIQDYGKLRTNGTGLSCLLYAEKARNLALFVMSLAWLQNLPGECSKEWNPQLHRKGRHCFLLTSKVE